MFETTTATFLDYFGAEQFMDGPGLAKLVLRLLIDLVFATIVIRMIYVRRYGWNDQVFTYFAFNVVTFSLCFLLRKVPIELGFALGLFAVFGILRYRTEPIRIRDLTYLFVVIGLAILNAVSNKKISVAEILVINSVIVGTTLLLEYGMRNKFPDTKSVVYDNLELLKPGRESELAQDILDRTGLKIHHATVRSVNLLRDIAVITVSCQDGHAQPPVNLEPDGESAAWEEPEDRVSSGVGDQGIAEDVPLPAETR